MTLKRTVYDVSLLVSGELMSTSIKTVVMVTGRLLPFLLTHPGRER